MLGIEERKAKMVEMHNNGATYEQIGKAFNLSRQRAFQIVKKQTYTVSPAEVERLERTPNSYALQCGTVKDQQEIIDEVKSEVAKEILADIHQEIKEALESNYKARKERNEDRCWSRINDDFINTVNGKIAALRGIEDFVTELEKEFVKGGEE
jgi:uncharacterized protein YehS (DUF1456 family)